MSSTMLVRVLLLLITFLLANVLSQAQAYISQFGFSVQPLCSLCLCGDFPEAYANHRDTENTEVAQRRTQATTQLAQEPPRDARAEQVADQIIKRFYETLNFTVIMKEFYPKDPKIRQAEINIIAGNMVAKGDDYKSSIRAARKIDAAALERLYLALSNYHWLGGAALATYDGDPDKYNDEFNKAWTKYYEPLNDKSTWPILTNKELDERLTASFNGLASFFRGNVVPANFGTPEFQRREAAIVESRPPESLEGLKGLFAPAGMKKTDYLYVARRGRHYIYLIEENGGFRMLSSTSRIRI